MPLGDSITKGKGAPRGYRGDLYESLSNAGYKIDFVGGSSSNSDDMTDPDHEGHSGWKAEAIRDNVNSWLNDNPAEIVLLHIGTNDISKEQDTDEIANEIGEILDNIDTWENANGKDIWVFLARIVNRNDSTDALGQATTALNNKIQSLADARSAAGDKLVVVDMESALTYPDDMYDEDHPNESGYGKMAVVWYDALNSFLPEYCSGDTTPTPTQTPTTTPAPSPDTGTDTVKPRIIVTTDGEVDDRSSMVRFLMYANDFDVEGIVQVNSKYQKSGHSDEGWIEKEIDLYEQVLTNLKAHDSDYPSAEYLRSIMTVGNENKGDLYTDPPDMEVKNTAGEQWIINKLLDDDPRPIHVVSWGGANTTASALWRLKYSGEYTEEQFNKAVSKIRIYCIWYQDGGGSWIDENVKEAYIYEAYKWDNVWDYQSLEGPSPDEVKQYMTEEWLNENVKVGHGPLGEYTPQDYVSEGDTPSFLHLVNNGLESHSDYTLGGWGGRAEFDDPDNKPNHLTDDNLKEDGDGNKMFWRWVIAAENDFAARMDWGMTSSYADANHQPVAKVTGGTLRTVSAGETINLDASATVDPDGNSLTFNWWQYHEADSAEAKVTIANNTSSDGASFVVPDEPGKQVHIILEVTDDGNPPLKGYQRIIFNITD
jgi:lysophospholipase L1-like esterase